MLLYYGLEENGGSLPTETFVKPGKSMSVKLTTATRFVLKNQKDFHHQLMQRMIT